MSDNQNIQDQPTDDSELRREENQPSPNDLSSNQKSDIENMEVHKHPHHVTRKKRWGEYLLEFFMLFLAVFLGFLTENFREVLSEHSKEKDYMHSLLNDLRSDTSIINRTIASNEKYAKDDSTLLRLLQLPLKDSQTLKTIYLLYPQTEKYIVEINDPKTFEQLKNTGDIRLIRKQAVLDSLSSYYQKVNRMIIFRDEIQSELEATYNLSNRIFDYYSFGNNPDSPPDLNTKDTLLLKEYINKLYHLVRDFRKYDRYLELLRYSTINFINVIEASYHLEKE